MGTGTALNSQLMKNKNRGLILRLIACRHRISRADISAYTGLTRMAVSNIVGSLIEEGCCVETEIRTTANPGRNPVSLAIAQTAPKAIGIYLSRDYLQLLVTDLSLNILYSDSARLMNETEASLTEKLAALTDRAVRLARTLKGRLLGFGISSIGPLDAGRGCLLAPTNFFGIRDYPIVSILKHRYGLPVCLNNDMNASALAELLFGGGVDVPDFMYVGISNGIGAGIVSDGGLYQNSNEYAGEIGHMGIRCDGRKCSCGRRGCLEVYANMPVLIERLEAALSGAAGSASLKAERLSYDVDPVQFDALSERKECHVIFMETAEMLSYALTNAANMLDPSVIFIGHEGAFLPQKYISHMEASVNRNILFAGQKRIEIRKSTFLDRAPLIGSACCLIEKVFSGELAETI